MTLLLDTHALVWWITADKRLGPRTRAAIEERQRLPHVSVVSIWEAAIKYAARRLPLPHSPGDSLSEAALEEAGFQTMVVRVPHALAAAALPLHHSDPFDRMLIAQAQLEDLTIVTSDAAFEHYDVKVLDART